MGSCVTFQIKGIIKTFSTKSTQISLCITVTLHVPVEQALQGEGLAAHTARHLVGVVFRSDGRQLFNSVRGVAGHRVLDAVTAVDQLQWCVFRYSKLNK